MRVIVSGLVGAYPIGGMAWHYLQYLIGLAKLGHDVYYLEDTSCWPFSPLEECQVSTGEYSAEFIDKFLGRYAPDLKDKWHYLHLREQSFGLDHAVFLDIVRTADVFLNVSGANNIPDCLSPDCIKVFIDTDPGYNQIVLCTRPSWSKSVEQWCSSVASHDKHFTFAENIHESDCLVPKLNYTWEITRMPIVLDSWHVPSVNAEGSLPWSTIMTWNNYQGSLIYKGIEYGSKGEEFEKVIGIPKLVDLPFVIALGGANAPVERLTGAGWNVLHGPRTTISGEKYQAYICDSRGEFSVAKNVYVSMKTGWFSERSACYLAAGKPVVTQDTGFSKVLPTGQGLLSFSSMDEAIEAIGYVEKNYCKHANAARELAAEYFDSGKVLTQLIDSVVK